MPTEAYRTQFVASYVRYLFVLGDLDEVVSILKTNEPPKLWLEHLDQIGIRDRLLDLGNRLGAASDRTTLAAFFHGVEAHTVENLKIGVTCGNARPSRWRKASLL